MRHRAFLLIFASILALASCVDYQEPTGPIPQPEPEEGELAPHSDEARASRAQQGR